ncbi:hypothetical protein B0A53_02945 [Rhodotorula sp. CCFEE 5036]|nr:hypothetical protein B0A53_02945 [Rhodotorula sp. CCFEE 5036]
MPAARRRISAPSRSVEREDEDYEGDDQHSGNASKPYRGLSDELIFNIYNELFAARHGKITSKTPLPGLNDILVSKRIYAVARSAWLHSFRASSSARRVDRVVAGLLKDDTACSALRFFEIKVFANHENTAAAVLERLSSVRYLRLFFDKEQRRVGGDKFLFSRPLVEGLAQMPSLRRLDLLDPVRFETDFPVGALRLRHVKTAIENILPILSTLLQQCAVQHLVMIVGRTSFLSIGDLPWASLQQLAIHFKENEDESAPADLLELLRAQPLLTRVRLEALDEDADFAAIVDSTFSLFAHDELSLPDRRNG